MDETFMSTKSSLQSSFTRDVETKSQIVKPNTAINMAIQPATTGQNRRSYSNPLMGAGIQITGTSQLLTKSDEMRFASRHAEENRKPINMKQLLMEQRRKFLAQQENEKKEKEKEMLRQAKLKKLRGNSVLVIDEASYEGSSVDESNQYDGEAREDYDEDAYDIGIKIENDEKVRTNRRSLGFNKRSEKMILQIERSRTLVEIDKASSGYVASSNPAKDSSYGINSSDDKNIRILSQSVNESESQLT